MCVYDNDVRCYLCEMAHLQAIQKLAKQALETFRLVSGDKSIFLDRLNVLKASMSGIRASDLGIDPASVSSRVESAQAQAPVGYIPVAENSTVSMGVFVVERGCRLPLHDHRAMHGIIKVLFGKIRMRSYDPLTEEQTNAINLPDLSEFSAPESLQQAIARTLVPVRTKDELELTPESESCMLTPTEANLHSIESVGGPAAFLDILSPPYNPEIGQDCMYYKETKFTQSIDSADDVKWLQRIPQPSSFWCCQEEYCGPVVDLDQL